MNWCNSPKPTPRWWRSEKPGSIISTTRRKPEDQKTGLRRHIEAARRTQLPLVIHSRSADDDMAAILTEETGKGAFPFILHCFSSGQALADTGVALGGYVSFSGILTFPKSTELREIAATVPMDRLLVETDAPYLAPKRWRGKRNEPSYVVNTAEVLAEVKGVSYEEIARITTANAFRCFRRCRGCDPVPVRRQFTVLGCASSPGVPRVNGDWGACDPANPKNRRTRAAFLIRQIGADGGETTIVVDTGPDFREQMIANKVHKIDAVLYTHSHADHVHGIDDLRGFALSQRKRIPIYADPETMARIRAGFGYCLETPAGKRVPADHRAKTDQLAAMSRS
jgi:hypothetical protein